MRYNHAIFFALLAVLAAGCISPPGTGAARVDAKVISISVMAGERPALGSIYQIKVSTASTDSSTPYRVDIMAGGEKVAHYVAKGNITKELGIPASQDGVINVTAVVFMANSSFVDTNASNDYMSTQVHILPYGNYTRVITSTTKTSYYECNTSSTHYCKKEEVIFDVSNQTSIYDRRTYGMLLHFDANTTIFSIGIFPRMSIILSPNATLNYSIYPVINGTPQKESVMGFSTSLFNIKPDWGGISILRRKTPGGVLPAGDYVLEISVDGGSAADIACFGTNNSNVTFERTAPQPKKQWYPGPKCIANVIISSRNELEAYKEYMAANNMKEKPPG